MKLLRVFLFLAIVVLLSGKKQKTQLRTLGGKNGERHHKMNLKTQGRDLDEREHKRHWDSETNNAVDDVGDHETNSADDGKEHKPKMDASSDGQKQKMNLESRILSIDGNTKFELNGEQIALSELITQYRLSKRYCGDDWENCKPRIEDLKKGSEHESLGFDRNMGGSEGFSENKRSGKKSLTSKREVNEILEGKGEGSGSKRGNPAVKGGENQYIEPNYQGLKGKDGDYFGRVDPINNEIVVSG